ncbi:MAG: cyclic pyranopterin monophosphate synthase MoaC [Actinomycetota bacterium]
MKEDGSNTGETGDFTHLDAAGQARMVNVGGKETTVRRAVARGRVVMAPATAQAVAQQSLAKGDVLAVARIAGVQAAKRTSEAIPLCHPLMLSSVEVDCTVTANSVDIEARVEVVGRTGVEMEALHACTVAALTVYDMCKAIDKDMVISDVALWEKTGGRSGTYQRV